MVNSISSYFITKYAPTAFVSYFCVTKNWIFSISLFTSQCQSICLFCKTVDDGEEELQSHMILYTLVTMAAPTLLLTLTTSINYSCQEKRSEKFNVISQHFFIFGT